MTDFVHHLLQQCGPNKYGNLAFLCEQTEMQQLLHVAATTAGDSRAVEAQQTELEKSLSPDFYALLFLAYLYHGDRTSTGQEAFARAECLLQRLVDDVAAAGLAGEGGGGGSSTRKPAYYGGTQLADWLPHGQLILQLRANYEFAECAECIRSLPVPAVLEQFREIVAQRNLQTSSAASNHGTPSIMAPQSDGSSSRPEKQMAAQTLTHLEGREQDQEEQGATPFSFAHISKVVSFLQDCEDFQELQIGKATAAESERDDPMEGRA
ncbi:unnamed protein product [Amoebophrya sp. A120]|nr:unnamed protein product [Amoebophrya sp. A120]|eukprot:GSA120T00008221001.1